jgi:LPXTG-motif cell wall-anchored protein
MLIRTMQLKVMMWLGFALMSASIFGAPIIQADQLVRSVDSEVMVLGSLGSPDAKIPPLDKSPTPNGEQSKKGGIASDNTLPRTGSVNNLLLILMGVAISLVAIILFLLYREREEEQQEQLQPV